MKNREQRSSRWVYGLPVLVILIGCLVSIWILKDMGLGKYPAMIAEAFSEEQHHLVVPGSKNVKLSRTGAYGIYYEYDLRNFQGDRLSVPPAIDCTLTSRTTGAKTHAAPDYIETNRYGSKDQDRWGVLIMSLSVDEPDIYTFTCRYRDGSAKPGITVALGPNYVWEFLRVAWKIGLGTLGGISVLCGSILLALAFLILIAILRRSSRQGQTG